MSHTHVTEKLPPDEVVDLLIAQSDQELDTLVGLLGVCLYSRVGLYGRCGGRGRERGREGQCEAAAISQDMYILSCQFSRRNT